MEPLSLPAAFVRHEWEGAGARVALSTAAFYAQAAVIMGHAALKAARGHLSYHGLVDGSQRLLRALERSGVRFEVSGQQVLRAGQGPFVFVCNHMSAMETQVLPAIVGRCRPLTFVVKPSLMRYPAFRHVLAAFDPIIVSRTNPRADLRQVLTAGKQKLDAGVSVIIFPQARRSAFFDPSTFGSMGMRLAKAAGVPMVPVALSTSAWGRGALFEDIGAINPARPARFAIGAPVDIGDDAFEAHRKVTAFIDSRLAGWSGRDAPLPASHGGGRRPTTMSPLMEARFPYNPTHE